MSEKVYVPEEITENPITASTVQNTSIQGSSSQSYSPESITETTPVPPVVARYLISDSLNSQTKRILQSYQFSKTGAIQIGEYENAVSGDIRISPDGIVARDQSGTSTFTLDGTTGSATFKGTVQAGSLISNSNLIVAPGGVTRVFIGEI